MVQRNDPRMARPKDVRNLAHVGAKPVWTDVNVSMLIVTPWCT